MREKLISLILNLNDEQILILSASLIDLANHGEIKPLPHDLSYLIDKKLWKNQE